MRVHNLFYFQPDRFSLAAYFIEVKAGETIIQFVDAVIDSSRYYVVKIKDPKSTRTTLLGIGFREREDAFDLKNCLNDYVKFVSRMDLASQLAAAPLTDDFSHQQQQQHRPSSSSEENGPVLGQVDHPDQEDQEEAHHHGGGSSGGYALSGSGSSQVLVNKLHQVIRVRVLCIYVL